MNLEQLLEGDARRKRAHEICDMIHETGDLVESMSRLTLIVSEMLAKWPERSVDTTLAHLILLATRGERMYRAAIGFDEEAFNAAVKRAAAKLEEKDASDPT